MNDLSRTKNDTANSSKGLFWFRDDLRLHDMPSLLTLCQNVSALALVYVKDTRRIKTNQFGVPGISNHRRHFVNECLIDLESRLASFGQRLIILEGNPVDAINDFISQHGITHLSSHFSPGLDEQRDWLAITRRNAHLIIEQSDANSLFSRDDLPFSLDALPGQFTEFRKQIEKHVRPSRSLEGPGSFPPPINCKAQYNNKTALATEALSSLFIGGETSGKRHVERYFFETQHVAHYKQTRNALDEWSASTKFSPWLASGAISARWVYHQLKLFESSVLSNDSTYWVYFELLWREFFFWAQLPRGTAWFDQSGLRDSPRPFDVDASAIEKWQYGNTGYPIVDACMRQLLHTGFMSNRGRQIVASCLVHELKQNWQYGAAWFEYQLIDYDVGSNWGNWLYLAGVGHDPRGHRQFDLAKQTELYDPQRRFISKWCK